MTAHFTSLLQNTTTGRSGYKMGIARSQKQTQGSLAEKNTASLLMVIMKTET